MSRFLAPHQRACVGRRFDSSEKPRIVRRTSTGAIAAALTGIAFFILYAALAARDVAFGDGPELTAAAIVNGVAHPPGYPLWILLGHVAAALPAGTLPFRVNLTACAYHAAAVAIVYLSAYALVRRHLAALFAAVVLGAGSPLFVTWSLQAEVFSLNDLFAAGIMLTCIRSIERYERWMPLALGALFGLGSSNHQSLVLLVPVAFWAAYCNRRALLDDRTSPALLGGAVVIAIAGFLLPYFHTLAVSQTLPAWHFGSARNLPELRDLVLRRAYGGWNLVPRAADQGGSTFARLTAFAVAASWPLAVMVTGATIAWVQGRRREAIAALCVLLFPLVTFCAIANVDVTDTLLRSVFTRFGLLPLVALAPFAAFVAVKRFAPYACALALIASAVALPGLSLRDEHGPRRLFTDVFAALPPHAVLMTAGDPVDQPPQYFQGVEGWRRDVTIVTYGLLDYAPYVDALRAKISVPPAAALEYPPAVRRDLLALANRERPFFVAGERGIHAPGPRYRPNVFGVVSELIPATQRVDPAAHYRAEVALETANGYGDVPADARRTNGFGPAVREYYAGGFFSTGYDAERLGDTELARGWYEKARAYYPDPMIDRRLRRI